MQARSFSVMLVLALILLALAACLPTLPTPAGQNGGESTPAATPAPDQAEQVRELVRQLLARQLQIDASAVNVAAVEAVDWPDACLGAAAVDEFCAGTLTPGYRLQFEVAGAVYEYHTNQDGSSRRLVQAPEPVLGELLLAWAAVEPPCTEALLSAEGLAFGRCDAPRMGSGYIVAERMAELQRFVLTYAAFQAQTLAGQVTFNGRGAVRATAAEQRMIAAWAAQVVSEAEAGGAGAGEGPMLAWHREGGIAGFCDDITVNTWGLAFLGSCRGEKPEVLGQRLLGADELTPLYQWRDALRSFDAEEADAATADGMLVRTIFFGTGQSDATAEEKQGIAEFVAMLIARWAETTEVMYVVGQQDVTIVSGPGESFAAAGAMAAGQTVQVTGRSRDGAWWRILCGDGVIGNCWVPADPAQTQPTAAAPHASLSPGDQANILAAVIRQIYQGDHTFGQAPRFPILYLVTSDSALAPEVKSAVLAALSSLPARVNWIDDASAAPRDEQGRVADSGAIISVGAIKMQPEGSVHVEGSIFVAPLIAGGRTYVVQKLDGAWQVTGDTGPAWIS